MTNKRFANAIHQIPQAVPPIWFMRQAGRYHSHYRRLKEKYSFLELCKNPNLAAEVALGPIEAFGFDVSILFSDLLFPLEALGIGLDYAPGPKLAFQLRTEKDVNALRKLDDALPYLEFQKKALQLTKEILPKDVSLIGFLGGPWTLFTYAASGKHEGNLSFPKTNPGLINAFYERMLPLLIENLKLQLDGGAEIVMIFDTAAGDLHLPQFEKLAIEPLKVLCKLYPGKVGYYAKGTTNDQNDLLTTIDGLVGYGIDHRFDLRKMLTSENKKGFVQGNFDQSLLFLDKVNFKTELENYLNPIKLLSQKERAGWVSGLGHGVLQHTPEENVKYMIDYIRETFDA
ncbi:uroporphyrinogen decarboxylase family protein [Leptospira ognonensis]|uniref:uroporphyrinogen decarboxylase family protein n=1 Tax=Leptospira ognonensis TaxID=2484945 RepID=UPI001438540F|nr:uroporphyrinogen decarboxylase family protein [Leptospira ognonensis]